MFRSIVHDCCVRAEQQAQAVSGIPVEQLRAMIRLLWPDEITPIAKRQLELLCKQHTENAGQEVMR